MQNMGKIFSYQNLIIFTAIIIIFFFIKDDGVLEYQQLSSDYSSLVFEMNELSNQLYDLKRDNIRLQNNDAYIEKISREEYFYIYPNEIIINF